MRIGRFLSITEVNHIINNRLELSLSLRAATQAVSSHVMHSVVFNNELIDRDGMFSLATPSQFTPTVDALWLLHIALTWDMNTVGAREVGIGGLHFPPTMNVITPMLGVSHRHNATVLVHLRTGVTNSIFATQTSGGVLNAIGISLIGVKLVNTPYPL